MAEIGASLARFWPSSAVQSRRVSSDLGRAQTSALETRGALPQGRDEPNSSHFGFVKKTFGIVRTVRIDVQIDLLDAALRLRAPGADPQGAVA